MDAGLGEAAEHRRVLPHTGVCPLRPQSLPGAPSPPREPREPLCSTLGPSTLCRDFGTEFLTCDCHLRWLLPWARNRSLQLSERTLCAYPSALHAQALAGLQEAQLRCGEQTRALKAPEAVGLVSRASSPLDPTGDPSSIRFSKLPWGVLLGLCFSSGPTSWGDKACCGKKHFYCSKPTCSFPLL